MNISRWLTAIFIIAVVVSGLGFAKFQQIQAAIVMAESFPEPSATVNAQTTQLYSYQESLEVTGQVVATQVIDLRNELQGIVTKVNFQAGEKVNQGQTLLALNTQEEEAQLAAAKANVVLAKSTFDRTSKLFQEKRISQQEYDSAKAQLQVSKANVANLEAIIGKKKITAPFDGEVGLDTFQEGQLLPMNSYVTTLVGNESRMWIDFQLAQTRTQLSIGDAVTIKQVNQSSERNFNATIIAKNSSIKAQSRHLQYRAEISNAREWLQHNEMVKVVITSPSVEVVKVPSSAISRNQHGNYVFKLEKDEKQSYRAQRLEVQLGKRQHDQQIVLSGIESNVLIATEGAFKLRQGLLVYPRTNDNAQGE